MLRTVLIGSARALVTVVLVTVLASMFVDVMPGDPAAIAAGEYASPETIERVRDELGLSEPLVSRYADFLGGVAAGDLGESVQIQRGEEVSTMILNALPVTLWLTVIAMMMAVVVAVPAGIFAALRPGSVLDRLLTGSSALLLAVPAFSLALLLVSYFSVGLDWFPAIGYVGPSEGFMESLRFIFLPAIAIAGIPIAQVARHTRGAFVETLERDYIRTAHAKGIGRWRVVLRHCLKNSTIPIITILGIQVTRVLSGAVVIERIFALPGLGSLAYNAVVRRDLAVMQGVVIFVAVMVVVVNLATDIGTSSLEPKARS